MQIAVYGGSFNPPHIVHAMVASWLIWSRIVDEVWLVPVYHHAFEGMQEKKLVDFQQRMLWCSQMSVISEKIRVCDIESHLPTPSYSIDTLQALQRQHPEHQFRLVVGSDVVSQLPLWKSWEQIQALFTPIIVGRVGFEGANQDMVFPNISSTELRKSLQQNVIPEQWLLAEIADALKVKNPYFLNNNPPKSRE